jgi:microcystin-dependent protein
MSWSKRSENLYVNDQAPIGLQYNSTTAIWETVFLDENQNKFVPFDDIFSNPVYPLPTPTTGTNLTLSGFLQAGGRVSAGTHFRAPDDPNPATPVYSFTGATDKGIISTANGVGLVVGGNLILEITSSGTSVFPAGSMVVSGSSVVPSGFLLCNGQSYSTTTYSNLFSAIGYTFGGSGANFNVPDLVGASPRGAGTSTGYTQNVTVTLGTKTNDALQGHVHTIGLVYAANAAFGPGLPNVNPVSVDTSTPNTDGTNGTPRTANETRIKNIGVNFFIKF